MAKNKVAPFFPVQSVYHVLFLAILCVTFITCILSGK